MADDIAKLGIEVLSDDVVKATKRLDKLEKQSKQNVKQNSALSSSFKFMGAAVAAIGLGAVIRNVISTAASFEKLEASLTTVTGSAEKATMAMDGITAFATSTPYQVTEITDAFIKLKALGIEPTEEKLRSFGNTSSAMGKSLNQMIEAVADAATGEFERLKEFGIKSRTEGDRVKFTFQGVTTEVGKNSKEITKYLEGIGKTQFAGAMEKQMDTLDGAFSNFNDTVELAIKKLSEESGFNELVKKATIGVAKFIRELTGTETADDLSVKIEATTKAIKHFEEEIKKANELKEQDRGWFDSFFGASPVAMIKNAEGQLTRLRANLAEFEKEREAIQEKTKSALDQAGAATQTGPKTASPEDIQAVTPEWQGETLEEFANRLNEEREQQRQHREEMLEIEMDYYDRLYSLQTGSQQAALDFANSIRKGDYKSAVQNGSLMLSNAAKTSKTMFGIQKALSLATAIAELPSAVISSFKNGGGYPWGLVPAGLMAAAGAQQIAAIKKSTFGGGGSAPARVSGGGTSPSAPVVSGLPAGSTATPEGKEKPVQTVNITLEGHGYSPENVRELMGKISEQLGDGVELKAV